MRKFLLLLALSLSTLLCGAQTQNADLLPEIRNTFFGLRLGTVQNRESIKKAGGIIMDFHDVPFEGKTWDIVRFRLDEDGILYGIAFQEVNEEPASRSYTTTDKTYETIKIALDEKYGTGVESQVEGGLSTEYFSENLMVLVHSYTISRDASELADGKVSLSYFHIYHFERPRLRVYRRL